jgi:hypothetical protein
VDGLALLVSAISWPAVGVGIGAFTALIALATAIVNHRIARENLRAAKLQAEEEAAEVETRVYLPARSHFVNRVHELDQAVAHIRSGEVVVAIEGGIGVGKSATATELAHRLLDEDPIDGEGGANQERTYVWIDGRNGCPLLRDICRALSIFSGDQSLAVVADDFKLDALRAHLSKHRTVLILDNLRLTDDIHSQRIREFTQTVPPGSLVIASVNTPGSLDGARLQLEDLSAPDAQKLIHHEVKRLGLDEPALLEEDFAGRLRAVLGGNPGMIEWFLRSFSKSDMSLDAHLEAVARGEGLEQLLAPIWSELTPESKAVLGVSASLRGQATAEQVAIATELDEKRVSSLLRELISLGLMETVRASGRPNVFVCARGVQRFVIAQTPGQVIADYTGRLATHYTDYFSRNWEDARTAISHLNALRAVLENLFDEGRDAALKRLFKRTLGLFFTLGLFDDRISLGTLAFESARRSGDHRAASLACSVISSTHAIRGELTEAREFLALGLSQADLSGSDGERARQMRDTGFISYRSRQAEQALAAVEGAEALALADGDLNNRVDTIGVQMASNWYLGRLDETERAVERYLRACREIPWERAQAHAMRYLVEVKIHRGQFEEARKLLDRARQIATQYDDARGLMRQQMTEARLLLVSLDLRKAEQVATNAEREATRLGLPSEMIESGAIRRMARLGRLMPPLRPYLHWRRPMRFTDEPIGGD